LYRVGEFVRDQLPAFVMVRAELSFGEIDIPAHGEGSRPQQRTEPGGVLICVNTHIAEVRVEARLHKTEHVARQS